MWGVATRQGMNPATDLNDNQALAITEYINQAIRKGFPLYAWPETFLVEERFYRADWNSGTAYVTGNEVYYPTTDTYYVALQAGTNKNPVTQTAYWEEQDELDRYIAYDQTGKTAVGVPYYTYMANPNISRTPRKIPSRLSNNGIQVDFDAGTSVFLEYQIRAPEFSSVAWASGIYAVGDLVYYSTTGESYKCIAVTTNEAPTDTAKWIKVDMPYFMSEFCKEWAYAKTLDEDGGKAKMRATMDEALELLADEWDNLTIRAGRADHYATYVPMAR
jgi:hypothetical protein